MVKLKLICFYVYENCRVYGDLCLASGWTRGILRLYAQSVVSIEAVTSTNNILLFWTEMRGKIPVLWFLMTNSFSSRSKYVLSVAPSPLLILTVIKIFLLHNLVTLAERMHSSRETSSGYLRLFNTLELFVKTDIL